MYVHVLSLALLERSVSGDFAICYVLVLFSASIIFPLPSWLCVVNLNLVCSLSLSIFLCFSFLRAAVYRRDRRHWQRRDTVARWRHTSLQSSLASFRTSSLFKSVVEWHWPATRRKFWTYQLFYLSFLFVSYLFSFCELLYVWFFSVFFVVIVVVGDVMYF